jgi:hypothetical protein
VPTTGSASDAGLRPSATSGLPGFAETRSEAPFVFFSRKERRGAHHALGKSNAFVYFVQEKEQPPTMSTIARFASLEMEMVAATNHHHVRLGPIVCCCVHERDGRCACDPPSLRRVIMARAVDNREAHLAPVENPRPCCLASRGRVRPFARQRQHRTRYSTP